MSTAGIVRRCAPFGIACLLSLSALLVGARDASAHTPPPIYFTITVDAEEIVWQVTMTTGIYEEWVPNQVKSLEGAEPTQQGAAREAVAALFAEYARVKVDRVPVQGVVRSIEATHYMDHGIPWDYVKVQVVYGTKGMPRQLALAWTNYVGGLAGVIDWIESEIEGAGETQYYLFKSKEPEMVWHAPLAPKASLTPPLPTVEPPPRLRLPLISLAILLLLVVSVPVMHVRRVGHAARWTTIGLAAALVLLFSNVQTIAFDLPFGERFELPSEEEALYDFESLLRNVYRAFDYDTEDAVYDTLARTVKGELLEEIYLEVNSSLVLREEGGAVSKVQKVEIVESEVVWPRDEGARYYNVRCRWRVTGKVGHWGHTHIRVNEYRAFFTVALEGSAWKIAKMRLESKERLDDKK